MFRRSVGVQTPGEVTIGAERRLRAPQPHELLGGVRVALDRMGTQQREALGQARRPVPFWTSELFEYVVHACVFGRAAPGLTSNAGAPASLVSLNLGAESGPGRRRTSRRSGYRTTWWK